MAVLLFHLLRHPKDLQTSLARQTPMDCQQSAWSRQVAGAAQQRAPHCGAGKALWCAQFELGGTYREEEYGKRSSLGFKLAFHSRSRQSDWPCTTDAQRAPPKQRGHLSQDGFSRSPVFDRSCMTSHSPCRRRQSPLPHPSGRTEVKHQNYIYTMACPRDPRTGKRWVSLRARPNLRDICAHFQFCIDQEWQIRQSAEIRRTAI